MRQITACLASASIVLGASALAVPAHAADDMGSNPITELFDSFGMGDKEKPEISYQERAPLVPPPTTAQLPPPQAKGAAGRATGQWPNDPDEQRRAEAKARGDVLPTETNNWRMDRNSRLMPSELQRRRIEGANVTTAPGDPIYGDTSRLSPSELRAKRTAGAAPTTPGPRTRLSDPPPGYLVGDGVTASVQTEKKAWYSRLLGN
ncbi:hypothetical protein [Hansschlegelia beijingensis]|uniref:Uncharacterized protein n=1 Tax=Hansschlegelia beijingensis TaxID=1133344 RepID=A0A7W6D0S0_9HYPH|nr:hypothetical protein [Hansschlegelia beijingensis]MBB3974648.1 hypothetical protein [Hansschlegelia beijingensis]